MQDEAEKKLSHKGVSKTIELKDTNYLRCLYEDDASQVSYGHILISKKDCQAKTRSVAKKALNGLYMKFHVEENRVSIRPHKINGHYL